MCSEEDIIRSSSLYTENTFHRAANVVATKIRSDMKETHGHMSYEGLDEGHARSVIPDSLYMLLQLLITETSESEMDDINTSITRLLIIAQDITYAASKGKKLTPKHIGLGLALHQATRSKTMLQLVYASGHTLRYEKTAWHIFKSNPNLLKDIGNRRLDESILSDFGLLVVRLYSPTSTCSSVNELCDAMFKKKNSEALPPPSY